MLLDGKTAQKAEIYPPPLPNTYIQTHQHQQKVHTFSTNFFDVARVETYIGAAHLKLVHIKYTGIYTTILHTVNSGFGIEAHVFVNLCINFKVKLNK